MMTGRENRRLLPLTSEPTFSPTDAHQMSPLGNEWRRLSALMQFLFEADPVEKAVHALDYTNRRFLPLIRYSPATTTRSNRGFELSPRVRARRRS